MQHHLAPCGTRPPNQLSLPDGFDGPHARTLCGEHDRPADDVAESAFRDVARAGDVHVGERVVRDDPHLVDGVQRAAGRVVERGVPGLGGEDAEAGAGLQGPSR